LSFVSCWLQTFGEEHWLWKQDKCDLVTLLGECTVCTASLARASSVRAVGCFDENMPDQGYEDWELWLNLVANGYPGTIVPEVLFHYRRRAGSMSSICCFGEPHKRLMRYLIEKHHEHYDRHMVDVLLKKERDAAEVLRSNLDVERRIQSSLVPEVQRRREELELLTAKLNRPEGNGAMNAERERLAARVAELESTTATLMASRSWKVTAPLRAAFDVLQRLRTKQQ
jgi:hypothetical protein